MEPPRSMLRTFVGCTSVDLRAHRHATQVSLAELASADVYILLLAWRYGSIPTVPPDQTLSVTHMEYRAAHDANMPRLIFLADPATETDEGPDALFPASVRDPDHATQVRAFRDEVGHDRSASMVSPVIQMRVRA